MNAPIKFLQVNGLTAYAFACGYIQLAKYTDQTGVETEVKLSHLGGNCYAVRSGLYKNRDVNSQTFYMATESIAMARKAWEEQVKLLHGARIAEAKADKRYSVDREHCGERDPYYVARSHGEWIGKSQTKAGAWLLAAKDKEQLTA